LPKLGQNCGSFLFLSKQTQTADLLSLGFVLTGVSSLGFAVGGLHLHRAESLFAVVEALVVIFKSRGALLLAGLALARVDGIAAKNLLPEGVAAAGA
jgi:hypothetical protein